MRAFLALFTGSKVGSKGLMRIQVKSSLAQSPINVILHQWAAFSCILYQAFSENDLNILRKETEKAFVNVINGESLLTFGN